MLSLNFWFNSYVSTVVSERCCNVVECCVFWQICSEALAMMYLLCRTCSAKTSWLLLVFNNIRLSTSASPNLIRGRGCKHCVFSNLMCEIRFERVHVAIQFCNRRCLNLYVQRLILDTKEIMSYIIDKNLALVIHFRNHTKTMVVFQTLLCITCSGAFLESIV